MTTRIATQPIIRKSYQINSTSRITRPQLPLIDALLAGHRVAQPIVRDLVLLLGVQLQHLLLLSTGQSGEIVDALYLQLGDLLGEQDADELLVLQ